jgi:hypothetical protein
VWHIPNGTSPGGNMSQQWAGPARRGSPRHRHRAGRGVIAGGRRAGTAPAGKPGARVWGVEKSTQSRRHPPGGQDPPASSSRGAVAPPPGRLRDEGIAALPGAWVGPARGGHVAASGPPGGSRRWLTPGARGSASGSNVTATGVSPSTV